VRAIPSRTFAADDSEGYFLVGRTAAEHSSTGSLRGIQMSSGILAVILGGGQGARLYPLTKVRSKPAVPIGGKYRLIDIPISNCLHSGIDTVYVLTQFNSVSLHRHIHRTYRFDVFGRGFVEILAAEQTMENTGWFQGTADAVRRSLRYIDLPDYKHILILSGDHLYRMDYREFVATHLRSNNDVTVSVKPVGLEETSGFGIVRMDESREIIEFLEKPTEPADLERLRLPDAPPGRNFLASMGIYVFRREVLVDLLNRGTEEDFGRQVIPRAIAETRVGAHLFDGYWQDIGTIGSFHRANIDLAAELPPFNFYEPGAPIYTHPRFLPSSKINNAHVQQSMLSEGSIVMEADIQQSIIGIRSIIQRHAVIRKSVIMGADFYETDRDRAHNRSIGRPDVGVGEKCLIENAIVDKNARIGDGVQIVNAAKINNARHADYVIADGIVVIPKDAVIPPGTVI